MPNNHTREMTSKSDYKVTHGMSDKRIYNSWSGMLQRCNNTKNTVCHRYGGRGIKVCDSWLKFENFLKDMSDRPEGKSLDRIDVNGDYCKENCRWATQKEQMRNTRLNVIYKGEHITDACERLGSDTSVIRSRLSRGWSLDEAFSKPPKNNGRKENIAGTGNSTCDFPECHRTKTPRSETLKYRWCHFHLRGKGKQERSLLQATK